MPELVFSSLAPILQDQRRLIITVSPSRVVQGMNVTFECSVVCAFGDTIDLNWSFPTQIEEQRTEQSNQFKEFQEGRQTVEKNIKQMKVYNITKEDEGNYTCHGKDSSNEEKSDYLLQVLNDSDIGLNLTGQSEFNITPKQKNVSITVSIKSHPLPIINQWKDYNREPIKELGSLYSINNSSTKSVLTIYDPGVQFSGIYSLFVNNSKQSKEFNVTLHVEGRPDVQLNGRSHHDRFTFKGHRHKIHCDVFGFPRPNITWYFTPCVDYPICSPKSDLIPPNQHSEFDVSPVRGWVNSTVLLWINQTGNITCKAENKYGFKENTTTIFTTDVENGFAINYPDTVVETDNVTLTCGASKYKYRKNLQWLYMDNNGTSSPDGSILNQDTDNTYFTKVNFADVKQKHKGNYSCVATFLKGHNKKKHAHYVMEVQKLQKPNISKEVKLSWTVKTGETVVLQCGVIGTPTPTIIWYKDGRKVNNSSKLMLLNNSQILTVHVGLEEDGIYECKATNKAGNDKLEFKIEVTDKVSKWYVYVIYVIPVLIPIVAVLVLFYAKRTHKLKKKIQELREAGLLNFEKGNIESLNPDLDVGEQADLLPYDLKKWEFPRDKLKLGKLLGSGAFGMVIKAEAYELMEEGVATTVAVKMVKRNYNIAAIKALVSELKIMGHLGKHLNVVNLLGACTGDLNKGELLVLVEYCQYGNLHKYLLDHRGAFINQVNHSTGSFDPTYIQPLSPTSTNARLSDDYNNSGMSQFFKARASMRDSAAVSSATESTLLHSDTSEHPQSGINNYVDTSPIGDDGYLMSRDHEWRSKDRGDCRNGVRPVCTQDLIFWGFQIGRGMEYLASRKVLHGDLAARNVLLADDNIVKICDFGLSKSMYRDDCYRKTGDGPLPIKWMALESILDKVFSTQSDVWAYGITLWELFTLARTPYPNFDVVNNLITKLQDGYRMEQPKYATKQVYRVMLDCWLENPNARPSFTELAERMGGMLEDTVRTHYVDLNDPFLQENREFLAQQDYLCMVHSPNYVNGTPTNLGNSAMDTIDEAMELTPMLGRSANRSSHDSPDSSPTISEPLGFNFVSVAQIMSFSNPSYHNLGRPMQNPYINMPD